MSDPTKVFVRPTGLLPLISVLGLVCIMCPDMVDVLTRSGGGERVNPTDQVNSSASVYSTFRFFPAFVRNVLGPRKTLMLGTWRYCTNISFKNASLFIGRPKKLL
ncbi:hypothetical protein AZE42_12795 [Rhizopogon vesiculosus]|uniref:Uncharacterized protein n=1 Tax=Rhizopogon vesiculosus TaxID=180088 RepID=A0A1J8R701_9AGAM|nr:hypothetical protein AZE42_12795 [Rhizopogon vesiculosus]